MNAKPIIDNGKAQYVSDVLPEKWRPTFDELECDDCHTRVPVLSGAVQEDWTCPKCGRTSKVHSATSPHPPAPNQSPPAELAAPASPS